MPQLAQKHDLEYGVIHLALGQALENGKVNNTYVAGLGKEKARGLGNDTARTLPGVLIMDWAAQR